MNKGFLNFAIVIGCSTYLLHSPTYQQLSKQVTIVDSEFQQSVENPSQRKQLISSILEGSKIPYCNGVDYDPEGKFLIKFMSSHFPNTNIDEDTLLKQYHHHNSAYTISDLSLRGTKQSTRIFLGDGLFTNPDFKNKEDIKHAIMVHEGHHATQFGEGIRFDPPNIVELVLNGKIKFDVIMDVAELDANAEGLKRMHEFNVSDAYRNATVSEFNKRLSSLEVALINTSPEQQSYINAVLSQFKPVSLQLPELY
ncbi:hypothetical protein HQ489_04600 [Candidatus Woesearchaeota archaeon]|nr:hypothetical protein [Candidatus Woesearchaeota archaeon]